MSVKSLLESSVFSGPSGWVIAKIQPISHARLYEVVAEMLTLEAGDDLLDIGCGPGAFLAGHATRVRSVAGLDVSQIMVHEAEKRLAHRIAEGTARLVLGDSEELPFGDGEFSAVTAITAPVSLAEVYRVLRPGGRFVSVDELLADPRKPSSERTAGGLWPWNEADTRRMIDDAGFVELSVRYQGVWHLVDNRIVLCRKPIHR